MIKAYAAFEPKGAIKPFEYDPGELKAHEVEIDVVNCGICHSDLSVLDNEWKITQYPVVLGHEVVGRIAQLGEQVTGLTIGQSVGLGWHSGYCHSCSVCDVGDHNMCATANHTIIGHHGGFADKVRAGAGSVIAIPEGMDLHSAGPLFCAGVTVFNPLVQFNISPTAKVAVIGIGGLGHLALQFLNAWGCEVTAFTSGDAKVAEALALGAHHALNSRDSAEIKSAKNSFDLIISTVDVKLEWGLYLRALKPRGRLHFVGAVAAPLDISVAALMNSQLSVSSSSVGSPATITKMLDFARHHGIKPIVERFAFDDVNKAMDRLRNGLARYRIVLSREPF